MYPGQPGTLNESMSDVFGSLVSGKSSARPPTRQNGSSARGCSRPVYGGQALRSMAARGTAYDDPVLGKNPQPARMRDCVDTQSDHGGLYINSGIPNHAFYITAIEIGGNAWEKARKIWHVALTTFPKRRSTFQTAANATFHVAGPRCLGWEPRAAVREPGVDGGGHHSEMTRHASGELFGASVGGAPADCPAYCSSRPACLPRPSRRWQVGRPRCTSSSSEPGAWPESALSRT
jgi:Thermolysin metallopeptidase, alpha-helical domain